MTELAVARKQCVGFEYIKAKDWYYWILVTVYRLDNALQAADVSQEIDANIVGGLSARQCCQFADSGGVVCESSRVETSLSWTASPFRQCRASLSNLVGNSSYNTTMPRYTWRIQLESIHGNAQGWVSRNSGPIFAVVVQTAHSREWSVIAICIAVFRLRYLVGKVWSDFNILTNSILLFGFETTVQSFIKIDWELRP